jgi:hypothetical protein
MKTAIAITSFLLSIATTADAAPDQTFFGLTVGAPLSIHSCEMNKQIICTGNLASDRNDIAASGDKILSQVLHFPPALQPDWMDLEKGHIYSINNDGMADAIEFEESAPSDSFNAQMLSSIHEHIVAKLGKETSRKMLPYGTPNVFYVEWWDRPWGRVVFNTRANVNNQQQPVISVFSTRFVQMQAASLKVKADLDAKANAKKLKF